MDDKFLFGVVLGMLGGAVLVTNSVKARQARPVIPLNEDERHV